MAFEHDSRPLKRLPSYATSNRWKRLLQQPLLSMPESATAEEWRLWREQAQAQHPVRYWLQEKLWKRHIQGRALRWVWRVQDALWGLAYRVLPRYRYHWLPTGMKPGRNLLRERQLHAMFHSFARFYEHQASTRSPVDWGGDEPHAKAFQEMAELYQWWTQERPARTLQLRALRARPDFQDPALKGQFLSLFDKGFAKHPEILAWKQRLSQREALQVAAEEEDQRMLHRLVDVRLFLW